jgi:hypothetical protein
MWGGGARKEWGGWEGVKKKGEVQGREILLLLFRG